MPPTAPSTVRSAPVDRWTSKPISVSLAMTFWTCASLARSRMTTTMAMPSFLGFGTFFGNPFQVPGLVDDALEQPLHRRLVQRTEVRPSPRSAALPPRAPAGRSASPSRASARPISSAQAARAFSSLTSDSSSRSMRLRRSSRSAFTTPVLSASARTRRRGPPRPARRRVPRSRSPARSRRPPRRPTARPRRPARASKSRSPSASGRSDCARIRATSDSASAATWSRAPVTPSREMT